MTPWQLFSETFAGPDTPESRLRIRVLAETLDRRWPLARETFAPTREKLAAFSASPEFREAFEAGKGVHAAFASWCRHQLFANPDEAAAKVLAQETISR